MSKYEPLTKADVIEAQNAWAKNVTEQNAEALLELYDFGTPEAPLLFKPTLTNVIRHDREGALSYFVGGNPTYTHDHGFLHNAWKEVQFESAAGPLAAPGGLSYTDMGQYVFVNGAGEGTRADYTFTYHKVAGRVLISLHHSSLTWEPA